MTWGVFWEGRLSPHWCGDGVRSPQMSTLSIRAEGPAESEDSTYGLG
jgi:hypothetical protein